jgi:hypothetical protein
MRNATMCHALLLPIQLRVIGEISQYHRYSMHMYLSPVNLRRYGCSIFTRPPHKPSGQQYQHYFVALVSLVFHLKIFMWRLAQYMKARRPDTWVDKQI